MRGIRIGFAFGMAILLSACAAQPGGNFIGVNTPADAQELPSDYKAQVEAAIKAQLKDPYSAIIRVGDGYRASCEIGIYGTFYGWAVPVIYNAKNSFGGYVGEKSGFVWFANGMIKRVSDAQGFCP